MTEIEILMYDGCTASEAQKHLERGTLIIDDLEEHFNDYMLEWGIVEVDGKRHYIQYVL